MNYLGYKALLPPSAAEKLGGENIKQFHCEQSGA